MGGSNKFEGRIEVYHDGWGSICRNGFDARDGIVVCRSLGYEYRAHYFGDRFGSGDGTFQLDNMNCQGNESRIDTCFPLDWGELGYCSSGYSEVGIECIGKVLREITVNCASIPQQAYLD